MRAASSATIAGELKPTTRRCGLLVVLVLALQACASGPGRRPPAEVPSGWPVALGKVTVTAEFGVPRGRSRHQGIDLAAPPGTPVWATADGVVREAGKDGDYGRTVVIDHGGGWWTRYAHLKKIDTEVGKHVKRGDLIGLVGKSGNASGAHLHYEVIKNGVPVNPRGYL
jgi:murein DD-endopeptidase MepM/ murein hydrolase activator NlpD